MGKRKSGKKAWKRIDTQEVRLRPAERKKDNWGCRWRRMSTMHVAAAAAAAAARPSSLATALSSSKQEGCATLIWKEYVFTILVCDAPAG